ncbi:uncharacterized protein LOC105442294 [Strongylocentrotus purpuratus]|uniref:Uncharacterized protein n=1 Tax=Strongylocentrotus purpuratus TaxID=7668 RepID=A0A7M7HJ44_STRPU|nr:uncharacterized protein LOC105442294 [Strongylocentrotus purpuratus]
MVSKSLKLRSARGADEPPTDSRRHVVLLATFFFLVLEAGVLKSYGVLLSPMVFQLDSNFATIGVIFSLSWTLEYTCAVVVKPLVNRIDPNKISMAGGLIAGVALTTSSFTRTTWALGTLFIFFGIGQSMVLVPAIICLHRHYKERFAFACSFAFVGSLVGVLILPIVTEVLIESYGPHNALLILGGLCLNMFPIGLVLKLPKEKHKQPSVSTCKHLLESVDAGSTRTKEFPSEKNVSQTHQVECHILQNPGYNLAECESPNPDKMTGADYIMGKETIIGGGYNEMKMTESTESFNDSGKRYNDPNVDFKDSRKGTRRRIIERISSLKTYTEEAKFFLAFVLPCDFIGAFVLISWTIFIVPFAISLGIPESRAVFVGTMGGVGGLVARVMGTVVLHFHPTWVSGQYVVLCSLTSLMLFVQPLRASYTYLLACSFFMGFGLYGSVCLVEALVSNVVSPKVFPTSVSITYLLKGVSGILTAYTSGSLYDVTGSYQIVFYILGIMEAANVGIYLLLLAIKKRSSMRQNKDPE